MPRLRPNMERFDILGLTEDEIRSLRMWLGVMPGAVMEELPNNLDNLHRILCQGRPVETLKTTVYTEEAMASAFRQGQRDATSRHRFPDTTGQ